jgi:hypothetical protein
VKNLRRVLLVGFFVVVVLSMLVVPAQAAQPGAIFSGQYTGQTANVDPIVSPGVPSAHPHVFVGAYPVDMTETTADLRTKPTTFAEQSNHSAIWVPEVREDGVALCMGTTSSCGGKDALVYYRCVWSDAVCSTLPSFVDDTRFVIGNANATSAADNPVFRNGLGGFRCGTGGGAFSATPPTTCDSGVLVLSATAGPCINSDGTATAFPTNGNCPSGFTKGVRVQQYFRFWVGTGAVGNITLGGNPSYTLHSDYFFGWDRAAFENFMDRCIRANVDCGKNPSV